MRLISIIALSVLQFGCAGMSYQDWSARHEQEKIDRLSEQAKTQASQSPNERNYQQGTKDGCASGNNATGDYTSKFTKNVDMYVGNQYYKSGWDDGFAKCKGQGEMINGVINSTVR